MIIDGNDKELTEKKNMLHIMFNEKAPISKTLNMTLKYSGPNNDAVITMIYSTGLETSAGNIHGGIGTLLLDSVMWFAAAVQVPTGSGWLVTSAMNCIFVKPTVRTNLRAVGKVIKTGKIQYVTEGFVYDDKNQLCLHATATYLLTPSTFTTARL